MSLRKKPNTLLLNSIIKYDMNKRSQPISKKYFFHPPPHEWQIFELLDYTPKNISIVMRSRGEREY